MVVICLFALLGLVVFVYCLFVVYVVIGFDCVVLVVDDFIVVMFRCFGIRLVVFSGLCYFT